MAPNEGARKQAEEAVALPEDSVRVRPDSIRISYKDPRTGDELIEDVFLDPRDSWCEATGKVILVTAKSLLDLQKMMSKETDYTTSTQQTLDLCRRDYLREHQRLMEELRKISEHEGLAKMAKLDAEIKETIKQVQAARTQDEAATAEIDGETAELVAAATSEPHPDDEECLRYLWRVGLKTDCILTKRLIVKPMHGAANDLLLERERQRTIVESLEGGSGPSKAVDAVLAAAQLAGCTLCDVICEVQDASGSDEGRRNIEDVITDHLRSKYEKLLQAQLEKEAQVLEWRDKLSLHAEQATKVKKMAEDVEAAQERSEQLEKQTEEYKQIIVKKKEAEEIAIKEREIQIKEAEKKRKEELQKQLEERVMASLSADERDLVEKQKKMLALGNKEAQELTMQLRVAENKASQGGDAAADAQERLKQAESELNTMETVHLVNAEDAASEAEQKEIALKQEVTEARAQSANLEESIEEAKLPPPKDPDEIPRVKEELRVAEARNAELRKEEQRVLAKQAVYEKKLAYAEDALKQRAQAEAEAAEEERLRQQRVKSGTRAKSPVAKVEEEGRPVSADDAAYPKRVKKLKGDERIAHLHNDHLSRDRRLAKRRQELHDEDEGLLMQRYTAMGKPSEHHFKPSAPVPAGFRHLEDVRVKQAGADLTVSYIADYLAQEDEAVSSLADELREFGQLLGRQAAETAAALGDALGPLATAVVKLAEEEMAAEEVEARWSETASAAADAAALPAPAGDTAAGDGASFFMTAGEEPPLNPLAALASAAASGDLMAGKEFPASPTAAKDAPDADLEASKEPPEEIARRALERVLEGQASGSGTLSALAKALLRHERSAAKAEKAWHLAENLCMRGEATQPSLAKAEASVRACEDDLSAASAELRRVAVPQGPAKLVELRASCAAKLDLHEPKLAEARNDRVEKWAKAISTAGLLERERDMQEQLRTFLREMGRHQSLLAAELTAPPEARKNIAKMRMEGGLGGPPPPGETFPLDSGHFAATARMQNLKMLAAAQAPMQGPGRLRQYSPPPPEMPISKSPPKPAPTVWAGATR
eukprot:gnl/TRDRNA2_/TRDRNA2_165699_c0_seq1.p1 gnl/TRDRNA2_/TRDRNA2_165699_c0~~gnl/TRDRNA2_/TRDRNA2_165699_c0_seq1.p1  ORF type:complete len:1065 (-),score=316.38 gnl/TRDRNA2_/TRDRNA2_165699_c0_seq1:35-3208(-)